MAGRPKLDAAKKRSKLLQMRVTEDELAMIGRAAHSVGQSPPAWARDIVLKEAAALNERASKRAK